MPETLRQVLTGLRVLIMLTVVLGIAYPLVVLGLGSAFPQQRSGSLLTSDGQVVGSSLIGQEFDGDQWFQSRPSAVDDNALSSGGSDISPAFAELQIDRVARVRGLSPDRVRTLVAAHTRGRALGFLGEPRVNVLGLNLALQQLP